MPPTAVSSPALFTQRLVFQDFDQESVFKDVEKYFMTPDALNLVIEFNSSTAHVAIDLDVEQIKEVLKTEVRYNPGNSRRWIGRTRGSHLADLDIVVSAKSIAHEVDVRVESLYLSKHMN